MITILLISLRLWDYLLNKMKQDDAFIEGASYPESFRCLGRPQLPSAPHYRVFSHAQKLLTGMLKRGLAQHFEALQVIGVKTAHFQKLQNHLIDVQTFWP